MDGAQVAHIWCVPQGTIRCGEIWGNWMPKVFFSRCKPHKIDAIEVALESKRLFFGYCLKKTGATYNRHDLGSCIVDVSCDEEAWNAHTSGSDKKRQHTQNRNFVQKIDEVPGSIALVPRPSRGVVYCGYVQGKFELVNDPSWYGTWEQIWLKSPGTERPEAAWIAGEVAQTWRVDEFRPIPLPRIPAWIRRSLFGRSTYGIVRPVEGMDPYDALKEIIETDVFPARTWTRNETEVKKRLIADVTPNAFEHLIVSLLQLEHPHEIWTHVGGSGDGGLDGIGADAHGNVVGLLQCKWHYWGEELELNSLWTSGAGQVRAILASASHEEAVQVPKDFDFLDKDTTAQLLLKHADALPQAKAMRIGQG